METNDKKRCRHCDLLLPITDFSDKRWRNHKGEWVYGLYGHCKKCVKARHDKYRKEHPDYWKAYAFAHKYNITKPKGNENK